ncbi:MAG: hypothetical protein KC910_16620 [Candidatus Eremiobacteraeota bacterium]|nr:hypothetical protein [Candidatus Eremiobacteraeota bacterium]
MIIFVLVSLAVILSTPSRGLLAAPRRLTGLALLVVGLPAAALWRLVAPHEWKARRVFHWLFDDPLGPLEYGILALTLGPWLDPIWFEPWMAALAMSWALACVFSHLRADDAPGLVRLSVEANRARPVRSTAEAGRGLVALETALEAVRGEVFLFCECLGEFERLPEALERLTQEQPLLAGLEFLETSDSDRPLAFRSGAEAYVTAHAGLVAGFRLRQGCVDPKAIYRRVRPLIDEALYSAAGVASDGVAASLGMASPSAVVSSPNSLLSASIFD